MVDSFIFHIDWIIVSVAIGLLVALIGAFLYPRRDHDYAASRRPTLLTRAITPLDKSVRGVRPRDLGLAGSTRSHLICAARHSISHRLYSPLQSRAIGFAECAD